MIGLKELHPILKEMIELANSQICQPFYPNEDKMYQGAMTLEEFGPIKKDEDSVAMLLVDMITAFCWPFTAKKRNTDGFYQHVFYEDLKDSVVIPDSMMPRVKWVKRTAFNAAAYDQVLAGQLSVPGAWNTTLKIFEFMIHNMHRIDKFILPFDDHPALPSVTNRYAYRLPANTIPPPFMVPNLQNLYHPKNNRFGTLRHFDPDIAWDYLDGLTKKQQNQDPMEFMPFTLWPLHSTHGTFSTMIDPIILYAVMMHSFARNTDYVLAPKGQSVRTEFHSPFKPEVVFEDDPDAREKLDLFEKTRKNKKIFVVGQAAGNCELAGIIDLYQYLMKIEGTAKKMIVIRGGGDFIPGTEPRYYDAMEKMAKNGGVRELTFEECEQELDSMGL